MSGLSTKESEDNEEIWKHKCMKCIRCNENTNCGVCWPCKLGKTCEKRRCFGARKRYEESIRKMADMNLAAIKAKTAAREAASSSGPITLQQTPTSPYASSSVTYRPEPEKKKRGRKKKSELAALAQQDRRINEMDYVPHRPTRQQSADLRRKRTTTSDFQSTTVYEPRQCLQPDCIYEARPDSKYCSDECGKILAMMRLTEVLPQRVKDYYDDGQKTFEEDLKTKQEKVRVDMEKLKDAEKSMMGFLDKLHAFVEKQIPLPPLAATERFDDNLYEACVVCGLHDISVRKYAKHIELCWARSEKAMSFGGVEKSNETIFCEKYDARTFSYCKRLKSLCPEHRKPGIEHVLKVCGYPKRWETSGGGGTNSLSELIEMEDPFGEEGCRTKNNLCQKHHKWVPSLRGSIELEMSALYQKMVDLINQGNKLRKRLQWSTNALSIMVHKGAVITDANLYQEHLKHLREQEEGTTSASTSSSSDAQQTQNEEADDPGSSSTQESNTTQASEEMLDAAGFLADLAQKRTEQLRQEAEEKRRRQQQEQKQKQRDEMEEEEEDSEDSVDYSQPGPSSAIRRGEDTPTTPTTPSTTTTISLITASPSATVSTESTTTTITTSTSTSSTTNDAQDSVDSPSSTFPNASIPAPPLSPILVSTVVVPTVVATNPADLTPTTTPQPPPPPLKSPGFSISRFLE